MQELDPLQMQADLLAVEINNKQKLLDTYRTEGSSTHANHIKNLEDEIAGQQAELGKLAEQGIVPKEQLPD